jgi:hypothetical protein
VGINYTQPILYKILIDKRSRFVYLSGAEVVILRIIENIEKMGDTSVSVSQNIEPDAKGGFKHNVGGELVTAMEEKIKKYVEAGAKNKMSYEIKVGHAADQLMKACE